MNNNNKFVICIGLYFTTGNHIRHLLTSPFLFQIEMSHLQLTEVKWLALRAESSSGCRAPYIQKGELDHFNNINACWSLSREECLHFFSILFWNYHPSVYLDTSLRTFSSSPLFPDSKIPPFYFGNLQNIHFLWKYLNASFTAYTVATKTYFK